MSPAEHYKMAEDWISKAEDAAARGDNTGSAACSAVATAHATLAAAEYAWILMPRNEPR